MSKEFLSEIGGDLAYHKQKAVLVSPAENGIEFVFAADEVPESQQGGRYFRGLWLALLDTNNPTYFELSFRPDVRYPLTSIKETDETYTHFDTGMATRFFDTYGSLIEARVQRCDASIQERLEPFERQLNYQRYCKAEIITPDDKFRTLKIKL